MGDSEIINRLLGQTSHLVRQAWAPVLVSPNVWTLYEDGVLDMIKVFNSSLSVSLECHCQVEESSSYSRPQATRFGGSRPFRYKRLII